MTSKYNYYNLMIQHPKAHRDLVRNSALLRKKYFVYYLEKNKQILKHFLYPLPRKCPAWLQMAEHSKA